MPSRESSGLRVEYRLVLEGSAVVPDGHMPIHGASEAVKLAEFWATHGPSASTGQTGRMEMRVVGDWEPVMDDDGKLRPCVQTRPMDWSCPCCGEDMGAPECDECREALAQ